MTERDIRDIKLELLDASPTQPRQAFNQEAHVELVDSMRQHGFAFGALLVRPKKDGRFEIIIGERRSRAAREVEIETIPCEVANLPDFRVLELQLVENLQRDDLNPIEEADSYRRMLELRDDKSQLVFGTIEAVAKRVGKDPAVVRKQIALCNLDDEAKAAVISKILPPKTAYLIARIPDPGRRADASQQILHPESNADENGVLSLREAEAIVKKHFQRDLRRAPFDQENAELVPVRYDELRLRVAGGACTDCPFKSANLPGISKEQKYSCLNPPCFDEKINAEWAEWQKSETRENRRALNRADSLATFEENFPTQPTWSSGLVNLDQYPASDELRAGEESPAPWRKLIEGAELEIIVARDRSGKAHELVKRDLAIQAAQTNGHDFFKSSERGNQSRKTRKELGLEPPSDLAEADREKWLNNPATREEKDVQKKKAAMEKDRADNRARLVANNCFEQLRKKSRVSTDFLRRLLIYVFSHRPSPDEALLKRYKLPVSDDISRNVRKWNDSVIVAFITEFILTDGGHNFELDADDRAWLKIFGIDVAAEEKRLAKIEAGHAAADKKRLKKASK